MKQTLFFLLCLKISTVKAQFSDTNDLQLYLAGGIKMLNPEYFSYEENISPSAVPIMGGGALWQWKKFQLGGEFTYIDGKKNTPEFGTIITGINFNLLAGYLHQLSGEVSIGLQTGFGYSLYHLSYTDKSYNGSANLNAAIYHNLVYTVPLSVNVYRRNENGLFTGLRVGYNFKVGSGSWRYMEGSSTETFNAGSEGLFFQLVAGGFMKLKKSNP